MKLLWPFWVAITIQYSWNIFLMLPCRGRFNSGFCNWVYARNCDYGFCNGKALIQTFWLVMAIVFIGNCIYHARKPSR